MKKAFWGHAIPHLDGKEQDGIHLLWTAPAQAGYSVDGFDIQRRPATGESVVDCHDLESSEHSTLDSDLVVKVPIATVYLREGLMPQAPTQPCSVYDIDLGGSFDVTSLTVEASWTLGIALREGKAIAADFKQDVSDVQNFDFAERGIDRMLAYVPQPATLLRICREQTQSPQDEEAEWSGVPFIAQGIQVPFAGLNPAVSDSQEERNLASSRLFHGETLDPDSFEQLSEVINEAAADPDSRPPRYTGRMVKDKITDPTVEIAAWSFATTLLIEPAWRRALGFGYFDPANDLQPGQSYDYRITGRFRRQDLEERFLGFHNVPSGTTLPRAFHFDEVYFTSSQNLKPEIFPKPNPGVLTHAGRKGLSLNGELTLHFAKPVTRVVLELEAAANQNLQFEAKTTVWIPGIAGDFFQDTVPPGPRAELDFPLAIDHVVLRGTGLLYGVRIADEPLAGDPNDVITASVILRGVPFTATAPPDPPPVLSTENLQQALVANSAQTSIENPPRSMGFRLSWLPPALTPTGPLPWPEDLEAAPPFDVIGFELERRRVDTNEPFKPVDDPEVGVPGDTRFVSNRTSRAEPLVLSYGVDLLQAFPESIEPTPPVPVWVRVDDVLTSMAHPGGPPPGSLHEYQIWSIDPLGRRSLTPTIGSVVRLEKRLAPPQPTAPPPPAQPPAGDPPPAMPLGVRARLLLSGNPDLSPEDQALLGTNDNAIVLEWGWQDPQRVQDPFAREFRVYYQPNPPDRIRGTFIGSPQRLADRFQFAATLSTAVAADALVGRWIRAGEFSFKILSHTAGTSIDVFLKFLETNPDYEPKAVNFVLQAPLDGSELRPHAWAERVDVVPITANEGYQSIIRDRLGVGPANPSVRVWIGVSAADDQSYVDDEIDSLQPNGGRPGNESSIIALVASARYTGRPAFTPPVPLADVPEEVLSEPLEDTVTAVIDLPAWFPALSIPGGHRVMVERMPLAEVVQRMSARSDDQIGADLPDGTTISYTLPDSTDQEELLTAIRTGEPARVPGKYLMDFLIRFAGELNDLWVEVTQQPVDISEIAQIRDTLEAKPDRYAYRIRIADASGRLSQEAALVPRIVRVPSLRVPAAPILRVSDVDGADLTLRLTIGDVFDVAWLLLFHADRDVFDTADAEQLVQRPRLLRLPNRRDLYPNDGLRLRLVNGTLLSPNRVDLAGSTVDQRRRTVETTLSVEADRKVYFWAVALTRDGIPSALTGPVVSVTDPALPVVPPLMVIAANGVDRASWTWAPISGIAVDGASIERSLDTGATWKRISPWLPEREGDESFDIARPPSDPRLYRLVMRGRKGQSRGEATAPAPAP